MIAAGTLLYKLVFKEIQNTQSDSGAVIKTKVELFKCKAAKVKNTGKLDVNAKELFHSNSLDFKIRFNKLLNDKLIVNYENDDYNITSFDINKFDNTVSITIDKINE
jgi:SPP1 family predicted phage head-tail adaptor